ncbi:MAG: YraN family protein [Elusimicrobiota bacterium]
MNSRESGARAEDMAAKFLESRGFLILERNFLCRMGEIDLVAKDGEEIVFVEVRFRSRPDFGTAAQTISRAKKKRIIKTAVFYAQTKGALDIPMRFDVVALDGENIDHIAGAFSADGV